MKRKLLSDKAIDALPAGREMNRLIAEFVDGWSNLEWHDNPGLWRGVHPLGYEDWMGADYSYSFLRAWEVAKLMEDRRAKNQDGFPLQIQREWWQEEKGWLAFVGPHTGYDKSEAVAVCRAMLKAAMQVEREKNHIP